MKNAQPGFYWLDFAGLADLEKFRAWRRTQPQIIEKANATDEESGRVWFLLYVSSPVAVPDDVAKLSPWTKTWQGATPQSTVLADTPKDALERLSDAGNAISEGLSSAASSAGKIAGTVATVAGIALIVSWLKGRK